MLVEAEIWQVARTDKGHAVLVKPLASDRAVPIFIGPLESQSILIGLGEVPVPRPLTHDLFISMLERLGVTVDRVEITDLKDSVFYSRLILKQGLKKVVIDSRPSDALGIAARLKCPVFIAEYIVDDAGVAVSMLGDEAEESEDSPSPRELERERLEEQLARAVDEEDYEEAAKLRDRIKDL